MNGGWHGGLLVVGMTVTAMLQDGARTIVTSSTFKKEADGAKFKPSGCDVVR